MVRRRPTSTRVMWILMVISFVATISFSQNAARDVVYLKNGSIVKGIIIEQIPNKSLKIQTSDGSIFVYEFSDVERITKENPTVSPTIVDNQATPRSQLALLGGVAIPTGDFASTSGEKAGASKTGYSFGAQYNAYLQNSIFWSLSVSLAFNPMDESAIRQALGLPSTVSADISSYSTTPVMVGFGLYSSSHPNVLVYGQGQIGMMFGSTPDMKFSSGSASVTQASASSSAFAYGFQVGMTIGGNIAICARYLNGQPKYKITASGGGSTLSGEYEQPTALFQVLAGIAL